MVLFLDFYVEPPKFFMKEYHFNEFCGHQCAPLLEVEFKDAPPMKREKNKEEKKGKTLELRLVGSHPLWGHTLSNAGMVVSNMMKGEQIHVLKSQDHPKLFPLLSCSSERCCPSSRTFLDVEGKRILELGAGAAVPSLVILETPFFLSLFKFFLFVPSFLFSFPLFHLHKAGWDSMWRRISSYF